MLAMTKHIHPSRPAIAAIAAVLVLATAPAGAQPAPDVPSDPVIAAPEAPPAIDPAPAPAEPAQPAPVQIAPQSEVVQAVPEAEPEPAAPPRMTRTERAAAPAPAEARSAPPAPAAPVYRPEAASRPTADSAATPVAETAAEAAASAPTATPASAANPELTDNALWALGGGALLFVGGLGALAFSRSRKRPEPVRAARSRNRAPATVQPAVAAEAAIAVPEPILIAKHDARPARAKAAASGQRDLEAMVAEAPSPENPFLTRSKRMRRAKFLLEHADAKAAAVPAAAAREAPKETRQAEKPKIAAKAVSSKSATTYSFGGKAKPRTNWKPATT